MKMKKIALAFLALILLVGCGSVDSNGNLTTGTAITQGGKFETFTLEDTSMDSAPEQTLTEIQFKTKLETISETYVKDFQKKLDSLSGK
jgi:uncharacterized protein YceK